MLNISNILEMSWTFSLPQLIFLYHFGVGFLGAILFAIVFTIFEDMKNKSNTEKIIVVLLMFFVWEAFLIIGFSIAKRNRGKDTHET